MGAARNFISIRPACLLYDTELLTQTSSQAHPATNHCVQQALHQRLFRPVCEAGQSQWCNNITVNFVLVHMFSLAGGSRRTAPVIHSLVTTCNGVHIYYPADLNESTEPPAPTEQAGGCASKPRFTFSIKDRTCTAQRIETQTIGCTNRCLVTTPSDPPQLQHVKQTVLVGLICVMAATVHFKPELFSLFKCEKRWVDYLSNPATSNMNSNNYNNYAIPKIPKINMSWFTTPRPFMAFMTWTEKKSCYFS